MYYYIAIIVVHIRDNDNSTYCMIPMYKSFTYYLLSLSYHYQVIAPILHVRKLRLE